MSLIKKVPPKLKMSALRRLDYSKKKFIMKIELGVDSQSW